MEKVNSIRETMIKKLKDKGPGFIRNLYQKQEEYSKKNGLEIGRNRIPFIHLPHFMEEKEVVNANKRLDILIETLFQMEKKALSPQGERLFKRLMGSLSDGGRELVNMASYESDFSLKRRHRRVDAYLSEKTEVGETPLKVIEVNQAAPLALHFHDTCQELAGIAMSDLDMAYYPRMLAPKLLGWLVDEYQNRYPGKFPHRVALPIEHGYPPKFTDLPKIAERIEKLSQSYYGEKIEIKICFPYDLTLRAGTIYHGQNEIVDMIWRNSVYMNQYKEEGKEIKDYLYMLHHPEEFVIVNSTRSWLTRNKETFSIIWDDSFMDKITDHNSIIKEKVRKIVPETYNLYFQQDKIDQMVRDKDHFITKPSDAGFGQGVEFGANHSQQSWEKIIEERSSREGFVFQKRVKYPEMDLFDINSDGELIQHRVEYDFCPHHVNGEFTGSALCRVNIKETLGENRQAQKMNLVSGGFMLPIYFC